MGTPGDVQPFLELGCALLQRNHQVTLLAHDVFESQARALSLNFESIGTREQFDRLLNDRNLWNPSKAYRVFAKKLVIPTLRPIISKIKRHLASDTLVYAQSMALGARIAQDKFDVKTITVHRQPTFLRSLQNPSPGPFMFLPPWMPTAMKRAQFRVIDAIVDHPYVPPINQIRRELGLRKISRWSQSWLNSPDGVIGFWNDWFAPVQLDWPTNVTLAGFITTEYSQQPPPPAVERFLAEGSPPIAFTFGSGNRFTHRLLMDCATACQTIGRRGLLLSKTSLSATLPPGVMHANSAPFTWLLPRCAALVHHGGIGTVAQSLSTGIPQLIIPGLVFDTIDSAHRIRKLGAGDELPLRSFTPGRLAHALQDLLHKTGIRKKVSELSQRIRSTDALATACQLGEEMFRQR
jgi:UDP:flavonoid glycosyltransferase YjiC (YdhE family)